jgi:hypothetical protein
MGPLLPCCQTIRWSLGNKVVLALIAEKRQRTYMTARSLIVNLSSPQYRRT